MHNYQRIRGLREDAELTQKQVAEMLYLHLTQYRRYECGESELPLNIAVNIAALFHVSLDYLAGLSDEKHGFSAADMTEDECKLLANFRSLSPVSQGRILERIDILRQQ